MFKKLKRKFILVSMTAVVLVLAIIMATINIINYKSTKESSDQLLNILADGEGSFPDEQPEEQMPDGLDIDTIPEDIPEDGKDAVGNGDIDPAASDKNPSGMPEKPDSDTNRQDELSPEAPFNTRYFTVTLTVADGTASVSDTDVSNIAAISSDTADTYALSLYKDGKTEGYYGNYRYCQITLASGDLMYIFVDCERDLDSFHSFLSASLIISGIGLLFIFVLLLLFSKSAVRPIALSYEKQKRFITDASHEIKTPLAIIDANTDVVEMETGESQWTASTKKQIERLTFLTEKLVLLSKMDEEQPRIEMTPTNISEILSDTVSSFEAVCTSRGKRMEASIEPGVVVYGNADTLRQACTLLIDNAIKYSDAQGNIRISCKKKGRSVILAFYNTVDDILPGKHSELFERFYRTDASRNTETGGFGIGLSTVKAIAEAHKGKASAKSTDSHSIEFTVTLPTSQ